MSLSPPAQFPNSPWLSTLADHPITAEAQLELPFSLPAQDDGLVQTIQTWLGQRLSQSMDELGLPGTAEVRVRQAVQMAPERPFRLVVNGHVARLAANSLHLIRHYVESAEESPNHGERAEDLTAWLRKTTPEQPRVALQFLTIASHETAKRDPSLLLSDRIYQHYLESLRREGLAEEAVSVARPAIESLLRLSLSVAPRAEIATILSQTWRDPLTAVEHLISQLRAKFIELRFQVDYLRELTGTGDNWSDLFKSLRQGLLTELGIQVPSMRFVLDSDLEMRSLRMKMNALTTPPMRGLAMDECLTNVEAATLRGLNIQAEPAFNPASGQPGAIAKLEHRDDLEKLGYTTWDARGFIILCLGECIRRCCHLFFDQAACRDLLENLELKYPRIASYVQQLFSLAEITSVARALLSEGVSIWNFRKFCESLAEAAPSMDWVGAVRRGMGREITYQAARGTASLVAYLLDKPIVDMLSNGRPLTEEDSDRILVAIQREIAYLPRTAWIPPILAPSPIRPKVRELIRQELPRVLVLAHEEITPDVSIQPVARINLP